MGDYFICPPEHACSAKPKLLLQRGQLAIAKLGEIEVETLTETKWFGLE